MRTSFSPVVLNFLRLENHLQIIVSWSRTTNENCAMENCQNWSICMLVSLQNKVVFVVKVVFLPPGRCPGPVAREPQVENRCFSLWGHPFMTSTKRSDF